MSQTAIPVPSKLTAVDVKDALRRRHPALSFPTLPGPWTCVEEWHQIDFLAFAAWTQPKPARARHARIGYEVKVSRSDYRRELLEPGKRAASVAFCHEFYFATPRHLLTEDEKAFEEPEWLDEDWRGERCPGFAGNACRRTYKRKTYIVQVAKPTTSAYDRSDYVKCPTCGGRGVVAKSRVEREAPTLWIPRDVGLVEVSERGLVEVVRKAPVNRDPSPIADGLLTDLVRWVSVRPDPRHADLRRSA